MKTFETKSIIRLFVTSRKEMLCLNVESLKSLLKISENQTKNPFINQEKAIETALLQLLEKRN
ncbi:hypothetical protein AK85_06590 [Streptococcus pneumoniae B1598]|nr:hypothetical protein AK85_06590 [Streptococcus pneumoniae B1598]